MASKQVIAELLVSIGVDAKDAEHSAGKLSNSLKKAEGSAKELGDEAKRTELRLKRMGQAGELAGKFASTLSKVLIGAATAVGGLGKAVIGTGARFEKLRAQLKTATGSAKNAEQALGFIKDFAKNTPFQVDQITEAFVKLTNLGLEPSSRALTSYGDTASAMGKELDQFIEAAADAVTGEFERLKEFGIKARSEGDRVTFTFRGMSTQVGKNAEEIEEFLIGLGEQNFAGAMSEQMGTLNGIISNLKDAFTDFMLQIAEMGPLEEFKLLVMDLRDASGDKEGLAKTLAKTLVRAIRALRRALKGDFINVLKSAAKTLAFVVEHFRAFIGLIAGAKTFQAFTQIAAGFRSMGIAAGAALGPIGVISSALLALIPIAMDAGDAIGDALSRDPNQAPPRETRGPATFLEGMRPEDVEEIKQLNRTIQAEESVIAANEIGGPVFGPEAGKRAFRAREAAKRRDEALARKKVVEREGSARREQDEARGSLAGSFLGGARSQLAVGKAKKKKKPPRGGGRRKKAPVKAPITSPTTVSEFFGAAARGELGPIAARTPSTKDIEPTVAVDITNNNFTFKVSQTISGVLDPKAAGGASAEAIKREFDLRLASAGQQLASNMVR